MTPEQHDLITRIRESAKAIERAVAQIPAAQHEMSPTAGEWSVKQMGGREANHSARMVSPIGLASGSRSYLPC